MLSEVQDGGSVGLVDVSRKGRGSVCAQRLLPATLTPDLVPEMCAMLHRHVRNRLDEWFCKTETRVKPALLGRSG